MTYSGPLLDSLLIGGTDLQSITGVIVGDLSGLLLDGSFRGENVTLPGQPGQVGYVKVRDAYAFEVPVMLIGDTRVEFLTALAAVQALMPTNLVTLTRRLAKTAAPYYTDTTCAAEYVGGTAVEALNPANGRTVLQWINLSGTWA